PDVQLHIDNNDNGPNARILKTMDPFTFPVPPGGYKKFWIWSVTSDVTTGELDVTYTLTYTDGSTDVRMNVKYNDWTQAPTHPDLVVLKGGLDTVKNGLLNVTSDYLLGIDLKPQKALKSVTIVKSSPTGWYTFFGATGE